MKRKIHWFKILVYIALIIMPLEAVREHESLHVRVNDIYGCKSTLGFDFSDFSAVTVTDPGSCIYPLDNSYNYYQLNIDVQQYPSMWTMAILEIIALILLTSETRWSSPDELDTDPAEPSQDNFRIV